MKTSIQLAALVAALVLMTGCHGMRHKNKPLNDPVLLPSAPNLEAAPVPPAVPGMTDQTPSATYSPLSTTAPATSPGTR